jgi:hypothetical protein
LQSIGEIVKATRCGASVQAVPSAWHPVNDDHPCGAAGSSVLKKASNDWVAGADSQIGKAGTVSDRIERRRVERLVERNLPKRTLPFGIQVADFSGK